MIKNCKITIRNFIIFLFIIRSLDRIINKKIEHLNLRRHLYILSLYRMDLLYNDTDFDLFQENIKEILNEITKIKNESFEPTKKEQDEVMQLILKFVRETKRKVYGGYALNKLIIEKNSKDAIYTELESPDIDFYSPEPIKDIIKLCNTISDAGYKSIIGKEALHKETYSIFVNGHLYCDISYVPRNIYNHMPFKMIEDISYIHPHFMTIDYFRMLTDPLVSYWRIDKGFKRFILLQKYYPLPRSNVPININGGDDRIDYALSLCYEFIKNRSTCTAVGFYAYNYYLNESGIIESKRNEKFKILDTPNYEIISTNYRDDARELISTLTTKFNLKFPSGGISSQEHYPWFQYTDFSVNIYLDDDLIATVYGNGHRCVPYHEVKAVDFAKGHVKKDSGKIRIGTFSQTMLIGLINVMRARTNDNKDDMNLHYTFLSHMIEIRNYYLRRNNLNIFNSGLFRDFVVRCMGKTMTLEMERQLRIDFRRKNKKPIQFKYDPSTERKDDSSYIFANSSGNAINNDKNLKLTDEAKEILLEEENEETETETEGQSVKNDVVTKNTKETEIDTMNTSDLDFDE